MSIPKRTTEALTINVEVQDRRELYYAALARAKQEGMSAKDYQEHRRSDDPVERSKVDLAMILDPGSIPGCDVLGTEFGDSFEI